MRGLPVNGKAPYGYKFRYSGEGASRTMTALGPDPVTYPIACRIWQMAKEGYTSSKIARALNADAIPTAKGALGWHRMTIQHLLGTRDSHQLHLLPFHPPDLPRGQMQAERSTLLKLLSM